MRDRERPVFTGANGTLMARRPRLMAFRPSAFRAGHIPSSRGSCERYPLSPVAAACRWSLLLLLVQRRVPGGKPTAGSLGPRSGSGAAELRITSLPRQAAVLCEYRLGSRSAAGWRFGSEVANRPTADMIKATAPESFWQNCIGAGRMNGGGPQVDEFRQIRSGFFCLCGFVALGMLGAGSRLSLVSEPVKKFGEPTCLLPCSPGSPTLTCLPRTTG